MPNDIDRLQSQIAALFKELQKLTTLDQRVTDIEKATAQVPNLADLTAVHNRLNRQYERIDKIEHYLAPLKDLIPEIDPSRTSSMPVGIEVKFKAQTVEHGVIELQKWPEGWALWCRGVLQWRSWK